MTKVYIVGTDWTVQRMFIQRGWEITSSPDEADLLQFTGGSDIDPSLYMEEKHATTYSNPERDARESHIFHSNPTKYKAGICRGAQLLNVLSGGRMWQHIDGHRGSHMARDLNDEIVFVTSTHHQMMRPSDLAITLMTATKSTFRETSLERNTDEDFQDIECVYYPHTGSFCFQPHPEYVPQNHECQDWYFEKLNEWYNLSV